MDCSASSFPVLQYFPEFAQTCVHQVDDAVQPSHPLSPPSLPDLNLSQHQGLFHWVGSSHQVAKVLELQLQHQSFQWIFRVDFLSDWLVWSPCRSGDSQESSPDHNWKVSFLQHSAFFIIQLSHLYMTTRKTIALTMWNFINKVMSLLFNKVSRLVIAFVQKNKCLLISWLQSPSAMILEPKKIKSVTASTFSPSTWSDWTRCHDLCVLSVEF